MSLAAEPSTITVAVVGNPNTGKSTLFTALAGVRQHIGNYPGVTVEKKIGHLRHHGRRYALVDLPGTYSLSPRSLDEMVAVDVLLGRRQDVPPCDVVVCVVDASNLQRNLYLVSQVLELGLPTVVALNMVDIARERGVSIDADLLAKRLGTPVVAIQANRRIGLEALRSAIERAVGSTVARIETPFPPAFCDEVSRLEARLSERSANAMPRYLVERLLLDTGGYLEQAGTVRDAVPYLQDARTRLADAGSPVPAVEAIARYEWVGSVLEGVCTQQPQHLGTVATKLDRVLTHRVWGTFVFAAIMFLLFSSIFIAAEPLMGWIDSLIGAGADWLESVMVAGPFRSLVIDGVIGGVGGVVVFLPQILILFMFIGILEDCGYMARAAFLMDKLMSAVGLSGKSFIPLLSSFACAIPGIMATRVIENRKDRLTTMLVAPLMSCSARLPVYTLLIGAFIPVNVYVAGILPLQGVTLFCMYLVGIVAAAVVALVLKRTLLRGPTPPFVMELPPYKIPSLRLVLERMWHSGWAFLRRAGTLIVAVAIVVWALLYYPHDIQRAQDDLDVQRAEMAADLARRDAADPHRQFLAQELARFDDPQQREQLEVSAQQRQSYLGQMGRFIEPAVRPLGWDWRVGAAVIASFPAREVVLGTLGVVYNLGGVDLDAEAGQTQLQTQLHEATWHGTDRPVFTLPMALGLMVFFALCAQCAATLVIIGRETNTWRWPVFTFVYMTALAYVGALLTFQIGTWIASS